MGRNSLGAAMKPLVFAIFAVICYAVGNVIMEERLAKYNNLTIIVGYVPMILVTALILRTLIKTSDPSYDFPQGSDLAIMLMMGVVFAIGDYFFIGAYTNGGSLIVVSSIVTLFPVVASLIKFVLTRDIPNAWQLSGYAFAAIAVVLVGKGSAT